MEQLSEYSLPLIIVSGLLVFITISFILLYAEYRKTYKKLNRYSHDNEYHLRMLRTSLESQENERKKISQKLHEEMGLMLQALNLTIAGAVEEKERKQVQALVDDITTNLRNLSWDLMPTSLDRFGLTEALDELCKRSSEQNSIPINFEQSGEAIMIDKAQEIMLYRVVQEAIGNALKHAMPSKINVAVRQFEEQITIRVSDNGTGFNISQKKIHSPNEYGLGIYNMQSRASLLGGTLSIEKNHPSGTNIVTKIPLNGKR
jgi:signal transduction histidine kinase